MSLHILTDPNFWHPSRSRRLDQQLTDPLFWRPSRLLDQQFGIALDPMDFLQPRTVTSMCPAGYLRKWQAPASHEDTGSVISYEEDKFVANLDVQQFKPEEISVKVTGENTITIEGEHEEKPDDHGQIYRHFIRRYVIPKDCDINRVESKLSTDGVLTIIAPRVDEKPLEHKSIPITQTGEPAKVQERALEM